MQVVELFSKVAGRYRQASEADASNLLRSLERCYAPAAFSEGAMNEALRPYREWMIASGEKSITIEQWGGELSVSTLAPDFRSHLAAISSAVRCPRHRAALEPFQLGRFCEFRAALIASRSSYVESTHVAAPNSAADAQKSDVILMPRSASKPIQLQIKAVYGASKRPNLGDSLTILRGVWITPLQELQIEIERIIAERVVRACVRDDHAGGVIPLREY